MAKIFRSFLSSSFKILCPGITLLSTFTASSAQNYIVVLQGGMYVVATADLGTDQAEVVTLQDRSELCRQALGTPREQSCLQEARERGMLRITWNVNCNELFVSTNNEFSSNLIHQINPEMPPSRAVFASYVIYDYACGTKYTR